MANNNNSQAAENAAMEELRKKLAEAEAKAKAAEEAKAAAEKKNAEAEAKLAALEEQKNQNAASNKSDKVRIKINMYKNGPKEDVQVFLNGRQYIIQRGVEVDVPRGVKEILENKEKMLEVIDAFDRQHAQ